MQPVTDKEASEAIAVNVTRLRGDRSKYWLAKETKTTTIHISRIERGERTPGAGMLTRLAAAFGVTVDALLAPAAPPRKKLAKVG